MGCLSLECCWQLGVSLDNFLTSGFSFPDWLFTAVFLSPGDIYQMSVMKAFGLSQAFGFTMETPEYMSLGLLIFAQLIWLIMPLILSYRFFKKRDVNYYFSSRLNNSNFL